MEAYFNRFSVRMSLNEARAASHPGQCYQDVKELVETPAMKRQLKRIAPKDIAAELKECGAWDDDELQDVQGNELRIIWIAACNIREENKGKKG